MSSIVPRLLLGLLGAAASLCPTSVCFAQIPGIPGVTPPASAPAKSDDKPEAAPTAENPKATVAKAAGTISVRETVSDEELKETLDSLLEQYPGVRWVEADVESGVVTLTGQATNDNVHDDVTGLARQVEGVRIVVNAMKTDDQVMTAKQLALRELNAVATYFERHWLVILLAVTVVIFSILFAQLQARYSDTILSPLIRNPLLRSVVSSMLTSLIVIGGVLLALSELKLTQLVLSMLGLAGIVGLAVGFAFRDITENFIASVLLGIRRPFQIGDYIQVSGYAGIVNSLNTRATVLITLEGNHVRIPNSTIFKEITVNSSAATSARGSFEVVIPYEASTAEAVNAAARALGELEGLLTQPAPRALVQALEPSGVRLRMYYWIPTRGVDGDKVNSDAKLKVKVALQQVGIIPSPTNTVTLSVIGTVPVDVAHEQAHERAQRRAFAPQQCTVQQVNSNLERDTVAAAEANGQDTDRPTPIEVAQSKADTRGREEGINLLDIQKPSETDGAASTAGAGTS